MLTRQLMQKDIQGCSNLFSRVFSTAPWNEPWSFKTAQTRLQHFFDSPGAVGVVALHQDCIMGFVLGNIEPFHSGNLYYLREMCVSNAHQGAGIGGVLIKALSACLSDKGVTTAYLTTERQLPAAGFYEKHGFRCSETMGFYTKRVSTP